MIIKQSTPKGVGDSFSNSWTPQKDEVIEKLRANQRKHETPRDIKTAIFHTVLSEQDNNIGSIEMDEIPVPDYHHIKEIEVIVAWVIKIEFYENRLVLKPKVTSVKIIVFTGEHPSWGVDDRKDDNEIEFSFVECEIETQFMGDYDTECVICPELVRVTDTKCLVCF